MDEGRCKSNTNCEACNQSSSCSQQEKETHAQGMLNARLSRQWPVKYVVPCIGAVQFAKLHIDHYFNGNNLRRDIKEQICQFTNTVVRSVVKSMNFLFWEPKLGFTVNNAGAMT
jgi:hypothetical protein